MGDVSEGLQTTGALSVHGVEGGRVGESSSVNGHATSFGISELRENGSDHHIVDLAGFDFRSLKGGLQDLSESMVSSCPRYTLGYSQN